MSINSSSSSSSSLPPLLFSSNSSLGSCYGTCYFSSVANAIFTAYTVASILLVLPLAIFILHLVHRRRHRSASASHCDFITYHVVVMEMIYILGAVCYCVGVYADLLTMLSLGSSIFVMSSSGQMLFHTLTCTERYLAVVHPIAYLHLRSGTGIRIRNALIWCVWLLSGAKMAVAFLHTAYIFGIVHFVQLTFSMAVVSFCSFHVLQVLKRPGPGEGGGDTQRVDQSKRRALHSIVAIMGALLLKFGGDVASTTLHALLQRGNTDTCVVIYSIFWLSLPSSLVLPLLFLHRAGKLPCFKSSSESGPGPS